VLLIEQKAVTVTSAAGTAPGYLGTLIFARLSSVSGNLLLLKAGASDVFQV
jgi:hypothetical protein